MWKIRINGKESDWYGTDYGGLSGIWTISDYRLIYKT